MKKIMTTKRRMMEEQFELMEKLNTAFIEYNKLKENYEIQKAHFDFILTQYNYIVEENIKLRSKIQKLEDTIIVDKQRK